MKLRCINLPCFDIIKSTFNSNNNNNSISDIETVSCKWTANKRNSVNKDNSLKLISVSVQTDVVDNKEAKEANNGEKKTTEAINVSDDDDIDIDDKIYN